VITNQRRRQFLQTMSLTSIGAFLIGIASAKNVSQVEAKEQQYNASSVFAPGKPAPAPSNILHGQIASSEPNKLTLKLGKEKVMVDISGVQMWRKNGGLALNARLGENALIYADYSNGVLRARSVWLGHQ
jgi:hypothetical protein